jgi:hypothetical protein
MEAVVTEGRGVDDEFYQKFANKNMSKLNLDNSEFGAPGKRSTLDFFNGMQPTATS